MRNFDSNSAFLSWEGTINRKDYAINMLILIALFVALHLVNFNVLAPQKILNTILLYLVSFLQFIILISLLSIVYRRINDFSTGRSFRFQNIMKYIFGIFFLFPVLYFYIFAYFLSNIPFISVFLSYTALCFILVAIIASIIFCFIKSKWFALFRNMSYTQRVET